MKKTLRFILLAAASTFFAACGAPAANTGANNANTNTTKPVAPTADALMGDAWKFAFGMNSPAM